MSKKVPTATSCPFAPFTLLIPLQDSSILLISYLLCQKCVSAFPCILCYKLVLFSHSFWDQSIQGGNPLSLQGSPGCNVY